MNSGVASIRDWLHSVHSDCRFALRQLRKSPGFAAAAVLTLGLGIGSTTAIFSVIQGALRSPYPYKNAERLADFKIFAEDQFRAWRYPAATFVDFRQQNHTFEDMFGLVYREVHFQHAEGTDVFFGGSVTPGTFESLGIPPLRGRTFTSEDAKPDAPPVFVIGYRLWTRLFHHDPSVVGTIHTVNGTRMTLVGVMPPRFQIGGCELWMPLDITRDMFVPGAGIQSNEVWIVGHLKPDVSPETAAADLQALAAPFEKVDPIYFPPRFRIVVNTFNSQSVGKDFKTGLFALMGAVAILLLIACGNVANLLLARATIREREFGIRSALGASRLRLIRQLLVESFALALASCALGWLLAYFGLKLVTGVLPPDTIPPEAVIRLSPGALLFSLAATILTTVVCGLAPALYALRADAQKALSSSGKGASADFRHGTLRSGLVVAEVMLSIVLAVCSALILRSLFALQDVKLGFDPSKVAYADVSWPEDQYKSAERQNFILRKILGRISGIPGVAAATEASNYPPYTAGWTTVIIKGKTPPQNRNTADILCSEGYFATLELSLLRGALFQQNDIDTARHVAVVNQTFVRDRFGEENPIGQQVRFSDLETLSDWPRDSYFEIIGVVADGKNNGLKDPVRPEIYLPATLTSAARHNLMVRTTSYAPALLQEIRKELSAADPNIAVGETGTIATLLQHFYYARPRFLLITLCTIAIIAVVLVAVGVFSVISYSVALQTHEIGVRMALGALPTQVLALVLEKGMRLIAAGIAAGLFASYFLTRLVASQIWGVSRTDSFTYVGVACLALLVGVLACLIPARRASRVDPLVALRYE